MAGKLKIRSCLVLLLYLFAFHSFTAGLLLIILPDDGLAYFGFKVSNRFFTTQSGVFHIVMAFAYLIAGIIPDHSKSLIYFIVLAKMLAAIFLFIYYFFVDMIPLVLLFGIGDLLMAFALWIIYLNYKRIQK
jgi:hypothetical protein